MLVLATVDVPEGSGYASLRRGHAYVGGQRGRIRSQRPSNDGLDVHLTTPWPMVWPNDAGTGR